jgi:protein-S-isoprenylcysteine O-methyltransferase Ste14
MIAKLVRHVLGLMIALGMLLFVSAGRLDWPGAWIFIGGLGLAALLSGLSLARHAPGLLAERLGRRFEKRQARWDKWLMAGGFIMWSAWFALMGFEMRFHAPRFALGPSVLGAVLLGISLVIVHKSFRENSFAVPVNRLQTERGHRVVSTGPYGVVRHPIYAGAIVFIFAVPLLLNSAWGVVLAPLMAGVFVLRAILEERMLLAELAGYRDYAKRVRYRILPGIW